MEIPDPFLCCFSLPGVQTNLNIDCFYWLMKWLLGQNSDGQREEKEEYRSREGGEERGGSDRSKTGNEIWTRSRTSQRACSLGQVLLAQLGQASDRVPGGLSTESTSGVVLESAVRWEAQGFSCWSFSFRWNTGTKWIHCDKTQGWEEPGSYHTGWGLTKLFPLQRCWGWWRQSLLDSKLQTLLQP